MDTRRDANDGGRPGTGNEVPQRRHGDGLGDGDFDTCWRFHVVREHEHLDQAAGQGECNLTA
jgi:hypothetical protein